jgi:hypothetical protein
VLRRIELHHRAARGGLLRRHLLEPDALRRGKGLDFATDPQQIVVTRHRPEAATAIVF